jgi:uncharacterized protein YjbI with pentapeptide repeats
MLVRKRVVSNKQRRQRSRRCCGLSVKDGLQFLSSLILPLMLGVFTVVITFQQQKEARQQRLEDKQQRELDLNISQIQEMAQIKAAANRYRDEVFVAYIKEMGDLLEKKNGTLTSDLLIHTLARVKTLNAIRQLDGTRQIHILRFLYEAGQLTNTNQFIALDISTAELTGIDFRKSGQLLNTGEISLAGVYLVNSTFIDIILSSVDFSSALLDYANFSSAALYNVNFSSANLFNVSFLSALLFDVNCSSVWLDNVNFSTAWLDNVNFSSALLRNVNFPSARLGNVNFSSAELYNVNFSSAWLDNVNFSSARFGNVDQTYFSAMKFIF